MKRILVLLTVMALLMVMLAMSVAPAFAAAPLYVCVNESAQDVATDVPPFAKHTYRAQGYTCVKEEPPT